MRPVILFVALVISALSYAQPLSDKILEGFSFRSVGPAGMSGRITAIDVVLNEPQHIYAGSASGGVWESTDGGMTWKPIFDDQPALSIGAIKINQQNPSEIWVGTGEGNPRNSQNSGKGIFRTLDGGRTWTAMGLAETKQIHRILIDHHNPSTIYVGASGNTWVPSEERGVYKSTDSGKTWRKILYTNNTTGVGDMVMDPHNPRKILVAMYDHLRTPWDFKSGGPGSGFHITYDGGETWKQLTSKEGMPKGELGRIGIAISHSSPNIVYALIEANENGLYKSTDGGEKWSLVSTRNIGNRPFYYHEIYVDPKNENRLWNLYSYVSKSEDGGRTFETILDYGKSVHPDHHAFWIHPDDPDYIIDGNDGGLNISRDGGRNWHFCNNLPVGQFYHIDIDNEYPYNIYGGMQDNGSWAGPSFVLKAGGIRNADWRELYFGDGFDVLPRRSDPRFGWAMSQGGNLAYYDRETGYNQFVKPVHPEGVKLRFNWNAALAAMPNESCGIYYGSQFLHRSTDCGKSWTIISPDLTTNDTTKQNQHLSGGLTTDATAAENHTTILCIAPSPVDTKVIWVGTDDGNVQLTRDGGNTWKNLSPAIAGMPAGAWIPQIEVSKKNAGEAFIVANHYRRGDWSAYVFHTNDFGATWKKITNDKDITSYVQTIVQDPVIPELLFLGADDGLYVSIDYGAKWNRFPAKIFPRVSTMDLKIHPADNSLVIGTFGRSIYVLDNIAPLRQLAISDGMPDQSYVLFPASKAVQTTMRSVDGVRFVADAEFRGQNRIQGVRIPVYVKPADKKESPSDESQSISDKNEKKNKPSKKAEILPDTSIVKVTPTDSLKKKDVDKDKNILKLYILNADGDTIRFKKQKLEEGWGTINWDMRDKGIRYPSRTEPAKDDDDPAGLLVMPGHYKVITTYNGRKDSIKVDVMLDPRFNIPTSDLMAKRDWNKKFYDAVTRAQKSFSALQDMRRDMKMIEAMIINAPDSMQDTIKEKHKSITQKIEALEVIVMEPEDVKGITSPVNLNNHIYSTQSYLNTSLESPGPNALNQYNLTIREIDKFVADVNTLIGSDWNEYKTFIGNLQWPLLKNIVPVD